MAKDPKKNPKSKSRTNLPKLTPDSNKPSITPPSPIRALAILFSIVVVGVAIWLALSTGDAVTNKDIGLNEVATKYGSGRYDEITVSDNTLSAHEKNKRNEYVMGRGIVSRSYTDVVTLPPNDGIVGLKLIDPNNPTKVTIKDNSWIHAFSDLFSTILLLVLMVVGGLFIINRMGGGMNNPMAFIKSRARIYDPEGKDKVTFKDVAGADEEKEDLTEVVDFLRNPKKYQDLGAKIPRGILMVGPPGTGKTLLARAVAGESNVPFFSISGSEFVEMFVGVGAARVRDLFREAKEKAPSMIFIDEIDAIGKKRSPGIGGGHDEREQTLNQILTEMDGFDNDTNVIILAATNRADVLDRALLRPGRFDRKVTINLPNLEDRIKILTVHIQNKPLAPDIDLRKIAATTVGMSGADLANLINESAILAGRLGEKLVTQAMIQQSIEKIYMGNTKKSLKMNEEELKTTAYHEAGHAIVGRMLPHTDPVHKISILSRGRALGVTWFLPERDTVLISRAKYQDELATLYGGRVAEEIFFGIDNITTGASNDIEKATEIARAMVMRYGFDAELGAENFSSDAIEGNYLGAESNGKAVSEKTHEIIDQKVRAILHDAYEKARNIITEHSSLLEKVATRLLENEEILRDEFEEFFGDIKGLPPKSQLQ